MKDLFKDSPRPLLPGLSRGLAGIVFVVAVLGVVIGNLLSIAGNQFPGSLVNGMELIHSGVVGWVLMLVHQAVFALMAPMLGAWITRALLDALVRKLAPKSTP